MMAIPVDDVLKRLPPEEQAAIAARTRELIAEYLTLQELRKARGGWVPSPCWRIAASMAKATITSETCRCQPCQERVSLRSRPSSFLAVSNASSIA
jgi:hypothetical protein